MLLFHVFPPNFDTDFKSTIIDKEGINIKTYNYVYM
jgi:hypothetical protein